MQEQVDNTKSVVAQQRLSLASQLQPLVEQVCSQAVKKSASAAASAASRDDNDSFVVDPELLHQIERLAQGEQSSSDDDNNNAATVSTAANSDALQDCFDSYLVAKQEQFQAIEHTQLENFIRQEEAASHERRTAARRQEEVDEKCLAAELATWESSRVQQILQQQRAELQRKVGTAERGYLKRQQVVAAASLQAVSECRVQFARVRAFLQQHHAQSCQAAAERHSATMAFQQVQHQLQHTDPRVVALEEQVQNRLYNKQLADLNELHMQRNLEEAVYLEDMLGLLHQVQSVKTTATAAWFQRTLSYLKQRQQRQEEHSQDLAQLQAEAKMELAKLIAFYKEETATGEADELRKHEYTLAVERRKRWQDERETMSANQLYDDVLWSTITDHLAMSTTASSLLSSELSSIVGEDDIVMDSDLIGDRPVLSERSEVAKEKRHELASELFEISVFQTNVGSQVDDTSTANISSSLISEGTGSWARKSTLSPPGELHVRRLMQEQKDREMELLQKHELLVKKERKQHAVEMRELRKKHQLSIEKAVEQCLAERQRLRAAIDQRLEAIVKRQELENIELRRVIENDAKVMQDALKSEIKRIADAEASSFAKAEALISAQVFHEIRNALSSVIAMSEVTTSLKDDPSMAPTQLISSVDDMMDQISEVTTYSLQMLNNILDVSKINTGTFPVKKDYFDLQDMVSRVTKMHLAKARNVQMMFVASSEAVLAYSDSDLVIRIINNLVTNAAKFTTVGAIQPFIWPLEDVSAASSDGGNEDDIDDRRFRRVAVGVADTGPGLSHEMLLAAKDEVLSVNTSRSNIGGGEGSGFGLHLSHCLAKALGTKLHLTTLENCKALLNRDMVESMLPAGSGSSKAPGSGTVLYIVLPVLRKALDKLEGYSPDSVTAILEDPPSETPLFPQPHYHFCPRPAPDTDCIRILVADDVVMLRKGVVHTLCGIFQEHDCPISISTARTAEDVLRAVTTTQQKAGKNYFDWIICDHLFDHPQDIQALSENETRPCFRYDSNDTKYRSQAMSQYFTSQERFTYQPGDGQLTGLEALLQILSWADGISDKSSYDKKATPKPQQQQPPPFLMLLTGHQLVSPDDRIVVLQKPLKRQEWVNVLEAHVAPQLVARGVLHAAAAADGDDESSLVTSSGCQLFIQQAGDVVE